MSRVIGTSLSLVLALALFAAPAHAALIYIVDSGYSLPYSPRDAKITTIDSATSLEQTLNAGTGHNLTDIAVTPTGQSLYAVGGTINDALYLYRYDPITGAELNNWDLGTGKFNNALVAESERSLLLMANDSSSLWRVNLDAAGNYLTTSLVGDVGFTAQGDLALAPDGTLYAVGSPKDGQGPNSQLYSISLSGGLSATHIGDMGRTNCFGLALDEHGVLYTGRGESSDGSTIYTVNTSTGATTYALDPALPCGIYGMACVPEPATLLVLTLGALAVVADRLLRKRRPI